MVKVMVFGSFDPLHDGHRSLFEQARQHGEHLIVILSRDNSIRRLKQREPRKGEEDRRAMVEQEELVTTALLGNEDDFLQVVEEQQPDVLLLGYDQTTFSEEGLKEKLAERNLNPRIERAAAFKPDIYKSSTLS